MRIIQFLNWDMKSIEVYLDEVKNMNFDTIQINPVQPFIKVEGYEWWATYQPLDFKIGNDYGSKEDLIRLCSEAKKRGIKIIVDVITNHLANDGAGRETIPHRDTNQFIRESKEFWKKHKKVNDFRTYADIINESIGLPGLNLNNEYLQIIILKFLNELKDCGVAGFRFDAAKHIGLPSDGVTYFAKIKEFLDKNDLIGYGEILDGPVSVKKELIEKKDEFSKLMYVLTEEDSVVSDKSKKITFVESHDTYLNEYGNTRSLSTEEVVDRYFELTKKYENTLFYVRDNSMGKKLFVTGANRCGYHDKSWLNNKKLQLANLHKGNESQINVKIEEKELKRKESVNMNKSDRIMELHHEISMRIHDIMLNKLDEKSKVSDYIDLVLLDYNIQMILNSLLGITPYDDFLINCIMGEFYKENWKNEPLKRVSYPEFQKLVLSTLKERVMNINVVDGLDKKIKSLSK